MLNAKSIRKVLCVILLATFALSLVATSPVLAYLYRAAFTVSNNGSTDYTALPVSCSVDVDWLIDNGFITTATALDTRIETLGGVEQLHMMVDDRIMAFVPSLDGNSQLNWYLTTGNSALSHFPVIVGEGGNISISDHADLELGNNFSIEFEAWIDAPHPPLYNESSKEDDWVVGYSSSGGSQSKNATYLYLYASQGGAGSAERTYVTDAAVDLTDVDIISINWENTGSANNNHSYFIASTVKMGSHGTSNAEIHLTGTFSREWDVLDVSSLTGNYYIRVHAYDATSAADHSEISVYRVLLDGELVIKSEAFYAHSCDEGVIITVEDGSPKSVASNPVALGKHTVEVWADATDFGIDIDGVTENSTALGGASVPDNSNNWTISIPYFTSYNHTVNSTLEIRYQPDSLIIGAILPNEENPGTHNGTINWGSNPSGVTVALGSLTAPESTVTTEGDEGGYQEAMHKVGVTDWFLEPDVGTKLAAHPLRPLVTIWSDNSTVTEVQAWRFLGLAMLLLITVWAAISVRGHLLIAGLACGGTIALLVQQTVWPGWTLVFIIPAIIAGVMAERTPSIG